MGRHATLSSSKRKCIQLNYVRIVSPKEAILQTGWAKFDLSHAVEYATLYKTDPIGANLSSHAKEVIPPA